MGKALRRTLLGAVLMLAAATAVPFLLPWSHFIPGLEREASARLGQPGAIDDLQLYVIPRPKLVASGIRIGRRAEIAIGELEIVPDLASFFSGQRTLHLIRAARVEVQEPVLRAGHRLPGGGGQGEPIAVERVLLEDVAVHHTAFSPPRFDADLALGEGLKLLQASVQARDGTVRLNVRPQGDLTFVDGQLYGGKLAGSVRTTWGKQWVLSGKASLDGVDLVPVQQALGKPARLSGRLHAEADFATQPDGRLLNGPFEVQGGAYQGMDLAKAGDLTGQAAVSDATPFEQLSGTVEVRGRQVKVEDLCVRSPKVVAGGTVLISPEQQLSGKLDVSVAKTGGFVGVPVSLGGTTSEPSYTTSKGYLIGAVIGTVLLPGIGTTLGATAASRLERSGSTCR
jgi:hypothetical protein